MSNKNHLLRGLVRGKEGAAAVEFAIVLNVLLLLLMGMMDFGHAWFIKQVITNASREGARAGVVYPHPVNEIPPKVIAAVASHLPEGMVTDTPPVVVPGTGLTGDPLKVTVTYTKTWWIINYFVPGLGNSIQIEAQSVMRYE
jgi:Flp pilus assembly protein TadG